MSIDEVPKDAGFHHGAQMVTIYRRAIA
jgi:hypothetical protein